MNHRSAESLLEHASAATGLHDFGGDDFLLGLRVLAAAIEESEIAPAMRETLYGMVDATLQTRLKLMDHRRRHPAIAAEEITSPAIVIGLPRTGTTALVDLLAQDPAARVLQQWETANLYPPADRADWHRDPRIAAMDAAIKASAASDPVVQLGLHTYGATLPDECNAMMTLDFRSPNLSVLCHLPRYSQWLRFASYRQPYRMHREVLQQLQHHGPRGRWTLKSPFHTFDLGALFAEYPDAVFVQTHRDPTQLMPSMCGLYATIRGENEGDPRRIATGRELIQFYGTGLQRALAARRDPLLDARVFDISHRAMIEDPMGTLRAIYHRFDLPLTAEAEARMKAWIAAPAQHMSGRKFTLAEFGLDRAQVDAAFAGYGEAFGDYF